MNLGTLALDTVKSETNIKSREKDGGAFIKFSYYPSSEKVVVESDDTVIKEDNPEALIGVKEDVVALNIEQIVRKHVGQKAINCVWFDYLIFAPRLNEQ